MELVLHVLEVVKELLCYLKMFNNEKGRVIGIYVFLKKYFNQKIFDFLNNLNF